ncbi:MAG: germination protein YpeB [Oscillospiraceae bacterium]|nr:germination protein YpeB [Oscillospiraceae bacterium]MBQ9938003.1 germination protein YpeB [Oscillospiraceae bacterium]
MKFNIKKRCFVRAVTFSLALVLTLGSLTVLQSIKAEKYKTAMENSNRRSFMELTSMMNNISTALDKSIYATSPTRLSFISATLWRESEAAKNSLASLPVNGAPLETVYRFLSQVGDYAMVMSENVSGGGKLSEEELNNMLSLSKYSHTLSSQLASLERDVTVGGLSIEEAENAAADGSSPTFSDGFNKMEESFEGYPKLIYDGPFSDNLLERKPLMTHGKAEISADKAKLKAAAIMGAETDALTASVDELSNMPCYIFNLSDEEKGEFCTAAVSKQGGYPVYYLASREIGEEHIKPSAAIKKAKEYLKSIGYTSLTDSYYENDNGVFTVNFAHTEDDIICYPDLIKVRVAMDNGEILGFDARGYLTNHTQRKFEAAKISEDDAEAALSPLLTVESVSQALIPSGGTSEALTYEFICRGANDEGIIVYVNTQNGAEEDILLLIESEQGILTR